MYQEEFLSDKDYPDAEDIEELLCLKGIRRENQ